MAKLDAVELESVIFIRTINLGGSLGSKEGWRASDKIRITLEDQTVRIEVTMPEKHTVRYIPLSAVLVYTKA